MFLFVMFVLISFSSFGQAIFPIDEKGEIVYSGVVNVDSINSKELYVRAHEWFANTFKSAKDVIQLDDKEAGEIVGKGGFEVHENVMIVHVEFTAKIETKNEKYKYVFSNFSYKDYLLEEITFNVSDAQNLNTKILNIIDGLKKSMNKNTNNW